MVKRMRYDIAINKLIRDACFNKSIEVLGGDQYRYFCFNKTAADVLINSIYDVKIFIIIKFLILEILISK